VRGILRWSRSCQTSGSRIAAPGLRSDSYLQMNARRLEHLAALRLPLFDRKVLQVGAGIGDLAPFFTSRGCKVIATDGRHENLDVLQSLYPDLEAFHLDLDEPDMSFRERFDIVFCYGTLYHLARPADAIAFMADRCDGMLLVETCVAFGTKPLLRHVSERSEPDQALGALAHGLRGAGCRTTYSNNLSSSTCRRSNRRIRSFRPTGPLNPRGRLRERYSSLQDESSTILS
jgi:hypothetical protein